MFERFTTQIDRTEFVLGNSLSPPSALPRKSHTAEKNPQIFSFAANHSLKRENKLIFDIILDSDADT